jgi:hypothetical protein
MIGGFLFDEEDCVFELVYDTDDDIVIVNFVDAEKQRVELSEAQGNRAELVSYAEKSVARLVSYAAKTVASLLALLARLKPADTTVAEESFELGSLDNTLGEAAIKEQKNQTLLEAVFAAENVDLAFIVDATRSVNRIMHVKDNIRKIAAQIQLTNGNLKIRLAIVVYRDLLYTNRFEVLDFVTSLDIFESFLSSIEIEKTPYYSDRPADMAGGIQKANELSWKHLTRIAFLIADSPCHGLQFHTFDENYPAGSPGIDIKKELQTLLANKGVYFGRSSGSTDKMIQRFEEYGLAIKTVEFNATKEVVSALIEGVVRCSIFNTITLSGVGMNILSKNTQGELNEPHVGVPATRKCYTADQWKRIPPVTARVYRNTLQMALAIGKLDFCRGSTDATQSSMEEPQTLMVRRATEPFAEGLCRIAYHAHLTMDFSQETFTVVLKTCKHMGNGINDRNQYFRQMEVSNIAHLLANEYNNSLSRPANCGLVHVSENFVLEEADDANEENVCRRFCAEDPLPKDGSGFTRYSSRTGYWNEDELSETLLRFTEFTYQVTR